MIFNRINEHTVSCVLHENEISKMGYNLNDLLQNQDLASSFLKDIMEKANEAGFSMNENYKAIQSTFLPNHQIILNIMELNLEEHLNELIQKSMDVYDVVNIIGKEHLAEILKMTGNEKVQAFQDNMADMQGKNEALSDTKEELIPRTEVDSNRPEPQDTMNVDKYLLWFQNLDDTEQFSKATTVSVPGKLFKSNRKYGMLINLGDMEPDLRKAFLLRAKEFTLDIQKDSINSSFLEEHAEVIIKKNAMDVLKKI